jgi:L-threonylcarbamoyladenylate synthase
MSSIAALRRAAELLSAGGIVAIPTESVYGLAADATNSTAVARLLEIKRRADPPPLIASDLIMVRELGLLDSRAEALARRFWPGPLTLVLDAAPGGRICEACLLADTIAIRIPGHAFARRLVRRCGRPLTATSANRKGQQPALTAAEVAREFQAEVELVVDLGPCPGGPPSTIARLTESGLQVLRQGAIAQQTLGDWLDRIGPAQ